MKTAQNLRQTVSFLFWKDLAVFDKISGKVHTFVALAPREWSISRTWRFLVRYDTRRMIPSRVKASKTGGSYLSSQERNTKGRALKNKK
jgi:hypothetical protein